MKNDINEFYKFQTGTVSDPEQKDEPDEHEQSDFPREQQIVTNGSITVSKLGHYIHCITIIGQIEGHFILSPQNKTRIYL